jgi:Peptidase family C25/Propeptide_C25
MITMKIDHVPLLNCVALKIFLVLAAILMVQFGPSQMALASEDNIRIISSDDRQITLVVEPAKYIVEPGQGPDGRYQRVQVRGWAKTTRIGHPELPVLGVMIPVPPAGDIGVEVLNQREKTRRVDNIYPVPAQQIDENGEVVLEFSEDREIYGASDFYPGSMAEVGPRSILKGKTMARLTIRPFQWNPVTKKLRYHRHLRLRITFGPAPAVEYRALDRDMVMTTADVQPQTLVTQEECGSPLRIEITEDGIYRILGKDIRRAGFTRAMMKVDNLHLYNQSQEIAIKIVSRRPYRVRRRDYVEFYATGGDSAFTDTNVYWLRCIEGTAKRMETVDGESTGTGQLQDEHWDRVRAEVNLELWEGTPGSPDQDYWFWEKITASTSPQSRDYPVNIPSPAVTGGNAVVRVFFQGRSTALPSPNHHARILLNGSEIGNAYWHGESPHIAELSIAPNMLLDGANTLTIEAPGDTGSAFDIFYMNAVEVDYWRDFEAEADILPFSVDAGGQAQIEVTGLSTSNVELYDVSDPWNVKEFVNFDVWADGAGYKAVFEDDTTTAKAYYALESQAVKSPASLEMWHLADLKSTANGADYILITARDFMPHVDPLLQLRQQQGLTTAAVAVEDIYNEFNYGIIDPAAIRDFLIYAYENWTTQPTYVLLLGDANTDYRDYKNTGKASIIPVHLEFISGLGLTPDDNWYACLQGTDILPDTMIGRIPAATTADAAAAVAKIVAYEADPAGLPKAAAFGADNNETSFETLCENLSSELPVDYAAPKIYLSDYGSGPYDPAKQALIDAIDAGMLITTYVGHGSVTNWAGEKLFSSEGVPILANPGPLTFAMGLTCLSSYFSHYQNYSLAEELVYSADSGAIGSFAPSGLAYQWEHNIIGDELFANIFQRDLATLGKITTQAKINAYGRSVTEAAVRSYTLIGDPATRLNFASEPL